jgi:hypothetical protein
VHCSLEPFPGIPVPVAGMHRAKAEQLAECCWAPLVPGLTPHGLRHGHQTAMRRDRVPRVLRRDRLGHGQSGDIADHYTHIDKEMIEDMLVGQTRRWQAAVTRTGAHQPGPRCGAVLARARAGRVARPVPGAHGRNPAPICAPIGTDPR